MRYYHHCKPIIWLISLLIAFFFTGCTALQKSIEPYQDHSQAVSAEQEAEPESSKSLPVVQKVERPTAPETGFETIDRKDTAISGSSDVLLPLLTLVADRIVAYEGKLLFWDNFKGEAEKISRDEELGYKIGACQSRLQAILDGYNQLHEILIKESSGMPVDIQIMDLLHRTERADINFLESECQQIIQNSQQSDSLIIGTRQKLLEESEKEIALAMDAADYQQVITLYEQFPQDEEVIPSFDTVYNYGSALLKTDRAQEARQVFQDLLKRFQKKNQMDREFQLMQHIADIEFGLQEYTKSFDIYVNIINRYAGFGDHINWARQQQAMINARNLNGTEVQSFADLLLAYLSYNPDRDGFKLVHQAERFVESFPESTVIPTVNRILFESQDTVDKWFALKQQQLNQLKNDKQYAEALQFIEELPLQEMPPDKKEYIKNLSEELITAQFQEAEAKRLVLETTLRETWEKGQNHLRAKEYDQAIEVFTTLLDTAYGERAREQIDEAANLSAQEDRRKAAELFVRASGTTDLDSRLKLLFESRQLLQDILDKYPQSDVVDKVRKNLERIEQEIIAVDPSLLTPSATNLVPESR